MTVPVPGAGAGGGVTTGEPSPLAPPEPLVPPAPEFMTGVPTFGTETVTVIVAETEEAETDVNVRT